MNVMMSGSAAALATFCLAGFAHAQEANLEFENGVKGWQTVLDGVMGGRSSGSIAAGEGGTLRFSGELSLENNGGFSQIRTTVPQGAFTGQTGLAVRVRGDGRTYQFDVRSSKVRMMASSYQLDFDTKPGEWITLEMPFDELVLHSFGQRVGNAPPLLPETIDSVGITLADKKPGPFLIELDWIRPIGASEGAAPSNRSDLASVASAAGLTTLLSLVQAAGLELPANGRCTIFAPTNEAFGKLSKEQVAFLTSPEGKATLQVILRHHIVAEPLESPAILARRSVKALSGQTLKVDAGALTVSGSRIVAADVGFDRGIVHVIDTVMVPELRSIEELLATDERLSTLRAAVEAAGLGGQLGKGNPGPWTVLAPANEAFEALPAGVVDSLLKDREQLVAVLAGHVLPTAIRREEMLAQGSARTLMGTSSVAFALRDGAITIDGAGIVAADIEAANGVIHVIDRVLLPKDAPATASSSDATATLASSGQVAAVFELAVARGAPMFNAGNHEACAAIYEVAITAVVSLGDGGLSSHAMDALRQALREGSRERNATERAWTYRRAMDRTFVSLAAQATR